MPNNQRRQFIKKILGTSAAVLSAPTLNAAISHKKVVIIGGGSGGATAAKYLKRADPSIEVTLISAKPLYTTCFMSNEVFSGDRTLESLQFNYQSLKSRGVRVVIDWVSRIDPDKKQVITQNGQSFAYDRCIVATGIDFKWQDIAGYSQAAAEQIPHAWQAGSQTTLLANQLKAMKDGGVVAISVPPKPYRCHPAPFERATQIAMYLKRHKPKSKIIIFDANTKMPMQAHFEHIWRKNYGYQTEQAMIEWRNGADESGIVEIDIKQKRLTTAFEDIETADVINLIPAQKAAQIALETGLTDQSNWCPVDLMSLESTRIPFIHVIGDSAKLDILPKTAYAANSQAKVCALAIASLFKGKTPDIPLYMNSCYAVLAKDYAVSSVNIYKLAKNKIELINVSGGITPLDSSPRIFQREVNFSHNWYRNITTDIFN